jgi:hypothetical protein
MRFDATSGASAGCTGVLISASSPYDHSVSGATEGEGLVGRLDPAEQEELLRVLTSPGDVRATLIRAMYEAPLTRRLAEDLMDLEGDQVAYLRAVADLRGRLGR